VEQQLQLFPQSLVQVRCSAWDTYCDLDNTKQSATSYYSRHPRFMKTSKPSAKQQEPQSAGHGFVGVFCTQSRCHAVFLYCDVCRVQLIHAIEQLLSALMNVSDNMLTRWPCAPPCYDCVLAQCVEPEMYAALRKLLNGVQYHARAKMLIIKPRQEDRQVAVPKQRRLPGMVCVVSAGPEDQAAADQVKLLAEHLGCFVITKSQLTIRDLPGLMDKLPGG